jgi:cystathionine gamma-synthase
MPENLHLASLLAQGNHFVDPLTGAIVPPIQLAATFDRGVGQIDYRRTESPTNQVVEGAIAELDGGARTMTFASGQSAAMAVFETIRPGQHVVAPTFLYNGIKRWVLRVSKLRGFEVSFVDVRDGAAFERAVRPGATALIWTEVVTNPTCDVVDIEQAARAAHSVGAALVVDATFTPPVTIRPLDLGADYVMQSATKYLNGHSDVLAGSLSTRREDDERWRELQYVRTATGTVLHPLDAWLLLRGMRTLLVRFSRISENALTVARHFESHPKVERVSYPGLESHTAHALARRQLTAGFGGMMAIQVRGGLEEARRVSESVQVIIRATSLGSVESLVEHRHPIEGDINPVPPNLIRLSIGIEDPDDLINDLEQALGSI